MKIFVGDFETTVYNGQTNTEVWASALVELNTEDVVILHSLQETIKYLALQNESCLVYYHNLKFDGAFWLDYLLRNNYTQAIYKDSEGNYSWLKIKDMPSRSFSYSISAKGMWYRITIKINKSTIEIRDSLKLLPFSVKKLGKDFETKHKKLDMEYEGLRYAGCEITEEERNYIANDVLVVKEALEIMFAEGHDKLTIGSCCYDEFKKLSPIGGDEFYEFMPNLYEIPLDENEYGVNNAGKYILRSYRGGWCYLAKGKENKRYNNGITLDVNSLYPSMMSSQSNNLYPVGKPTFWKGNYIPKGIENKAYYFFIRIRTRFKLKKGYLPFISIKGNPLYPPHDSLETSDVYNDETGEYCPYYKDIDGNIQKARVTLTLTCIDYWLIFEHYTLYDFEILDGCYFKAVGCDYLFDDYIEKYKTIKMNSKGAKRQLAKLFLNNLYGKMATNTDSSFKLARLDEDGNVKFDLILENKKKPGYIAIGSAITSYARQFTIRAAQKNYHGVDKQGFIYADTDSIHCDLDMKDVKGVELSDNEFCKWKLESQWDFGLFVRQKTYIEHTDYYDVKCAGMPDKCKSLFIKSVTQNYDDGYLSKLSEEEIEFVKKKRKLEDFKVGLCVPGKLLPKRIHGGIVLAETNFEMR